MTTVTDPRPDRPDPGPVTPGRRLGLARFLGLTAGGLAPIVVALLLPIGTWADLGALPFHPLVVHGLVVALPVAAIWLLLAVWRPTVLERSYPALWALSALAVVGVIVAQSSGDSLAAAVGLPAGHAEAGRRLLPGAVALAGTVLALGLVRLVHPLRFVAGAVRAVGVVVALAVLPLTYLAGHSGAEAVWEREYAEARAPISREWIAVSLDEVRRHDTRDDCWAVVSGSVYDLTSFVARHPAGPGDITELCGTDATEDFLDEHGGQGEPEQWLATLKIGQVRR